MVTYSEESHSEVAGSQEMRAQTSRFLPKIPERDVIQNLAEPLPINSGMSAVPVKQILRRFNNLHPERHFWRSWKTGAAK